MAGPGDAAAATGGDAGADPASPGVPDRDGSSSAGDEVRPGRYRHYKGQDYEVVGEARHSETEEVLVVYRALYGEHGLWVRPKAMWLQTVDVDGARVPRFGRIDAA